MRAQVLQKCQEWAPDGESNADADVVEFVSRVAQWSADLSPSSFPTTTIPPAMKFLRASAIVSVAAAIAAHDAPVNAKREHAVRQAASSASAPASSAAPSSGASSLPPASGATTLSFTLASTNPTAIPLSSIVANAPSAPTLAVTDAPAAGTTPSAISEAPGLPAVTIIPSSYPALDRPPPTDSPEVQQWKQEVANSGVQIPNFDPTVAGGCPANAQAAADSTRCWWTCGGCTRDTDVTDCPSQYTWGLTYDDGPSFYTPNLLQYLDEQQLKSTFFVVGSRVISFPATLQAEYAKGHQIAVHTWSHPALTTLTNDEIIAELGWTKKAIKDVLGVTPNMMRPPFGDIDDRVRAISTAMGLTPVMWTRISPAATFDTDDFNIHGGLTTVEQVLDNWNNILGNVSTLDNGFIVLEHDLFQQSVEVATGYILPDALSHDPPFQIQPVISCLNKPMRDAYIEVNDNATNPPAASGSVVTFSSGQPGSAQETGSSGDNGAAQLDPGYLGAFGLAAAIGVIALGL